METESTLDRYCIDTNSLVRCAERFPSLERYGIWAALSGLVSSGRLFAPRTVRVEAYRLSRLVEEWGQRHDSLFVKTTPDLVARQAQVRERWPGLLKVSSTGEDADPWIVALAWLVNDASGFWRGPCVVVTQERRRRGLGAAPKIPDACDALNIECVDLDGLIEREDWRFELA